MPLPEQSSWVRETRFGKWFVSTNIWLRYVLSEAVVDLKQMLGRRVPEVNRILDAGCGQGLSFALLQQHFKPRVIVGADIDKALLDVAAGAASGCPCEVQLEHGAIASLNCPDNYFDVIFCHQLIHHLSDQASALRELYRILAAGGVLLISESCRPFIETCLVRLLFRHPANVQKTAAEYVDLVKSIGFEVEQKDVKTSSPWWSLSDFGLMEKLGFPRKEPVPITEVLIIATK